MRDDGLTEAQWQPHLINRTLPPGTDPAAATMMITWRETHSYLTRLRVGPGQRLLILGSGGNGFSFLVMARALGVEQIVMVGNPHWAGLAERAGAAAFVDYRGPDVGTDLDRTSPGGFDLVLDAIGRTGALEMAVDRLVSGGRVAMYGIDDLGERMGYLADLRGRGIEAHGPGEYSEAEAHEAVVALLETGRLNASIWFDPAAPVSLDDLMQAVADIDGKKSLKALVRLSR
ncbi:MAG: zinc-binding dehydrogenase [Pseudomonadales bacterium]